MKTKFFPITITSFCAAQLFVQTIRMIPVQKKLIFKNKIMKHLKLILAILLSSFLLYSCTGNTSATTRRDSDSVASSGTTASTSDASFSYKIDGKVFSGNGTDKNFNCAFNHPGNVVHFILTDMDPNLTKAPPQFSFSVADNGTTVVRKDDMERFSSGNNVKYFANFSIPGGGTGEIPRYEFNTASTVTVTITSNTPSRLAGTFSGQLLNPDTQKDVQLTDGSFDIPFVPASK